jgi:hypothetical protein
MRGAAAANKTMSCVSELRGMMIVWKPFYFARRDLRNIPWVHSTNGQIRFTDLAARLSTDGLLRASRRKDTLDAVVSLGMHDKRFYRRL